MVHPSPVRPVVDLPVWHDAPMTTPAKSYEDMTPEERAAGTPWDPARQAAGEAQLAELAAQEKVTAAQQNADALAAAGLPTPPAV